MNTIKTFYTNLGEEGRKSLLRISIFFGILLLILVSVLAYNSYINRTERIKIIDYPKQAPKSYKKTVEKMLHRVLSNNTEVKKHSFLSGVVRKDSYSETSEDGTTNASFLVDIDSHKYTFKATLSWSKTEETPNGVLISCPAKEESKYPDTPCKGMYSESKDSEIIFNLPYRGTTKTGKEYIIYERHYYKSKDPYLEIAINSCGDQTILSEALESAKDWIESNGGNPDSFKFETPATYCEGSAS